MSTSPNGHIARQESQRRRRREQHRRRSQLLYRDRQNMHELNLVLDVNDLRAQVVHLERLASLYQTQQVHAQMQWDGELVGRVEQYYRLFRHGLLSSDDLRQSRTRQALACRQREFTRWFMDASSPFPCNDGVLDAEECLVLWSRASARYPGLTMRLLSHRVVRVDADRIVEVTVQAHSQISRTTVAELFPWALRHETLVQSLLHEHLEMFLQNQFFFDSTGRLVRYIKSVEMSASLVRLVHRIQHLCLHLDASHEPQVPCFLIESEPDAPDHLQLFDHQQNLNYQIGRETSDSSVDTWISAATSHEADDEELKGEEEEEEEQQQQTSPRQSSKHDIRYVLS